MAGTHGSSTLDSAGVEFREYDWGEVVIGPKEKLQALGLGGGRPFPGEPGGNKRRMSVRDPRGFSAEITLCATDGNYRASITFGGRADTRFMSRWHEIAPGLQKSTDHQYGDEFFGTGAALAAAGLIDPARLPGLPGLPKTILGVSSDGRLMRTAHTNLDDPGMRVISRRGDNFHVFVVAPADERTRRANAWDTLVAEWRGRMRALPRPPSLLDVVFGTGAPTSARNRAHLRLVWSARPTES